MTATSNFQTACRGTIVESTPGKLILAIPRTDYRLHLVPSSPINAKPGDRINGTVHVRAKRIDVTRQGGAFIDPVIGRPANIQGRIAKVGSEDQTIIVDSAIPVWVKVAPPQSPTDFAPGTLIVFAVEPGATFTPSPNPDNEPRP